MAPKAPPSGNSELPFHWILSSQDTQVYEANALGLGVYPKGRSARDVPCSGGESPPTLSFLQGNPRPLSLSLQEGSSRPSNLPVGGNPRPSWRLRGSSAQHSWESRSRSGLPAPVRPGPGQGDAVWWRLRGSPVSGARDCASCGCGSTTALQLRAGAAAAPAAAAAARGLAGRRLGPNAHEAAGASDQPRAGETIVGCSQDVGIRMGVGWYLRDRVRRGKFTDKSGCGNPSRDNTVIGGAEAVSHVSRRKLPSYPAGGGEDAAAGRGPGRAGPRHRDKPRRTAGYT